MRFEFATAGRVIFGRGTAVEVAGEARTLGSRALLVTGGHPERAAGLGERLRAGGVAVTVYPVAGEPTIACVTEGREVATAQGCDVVIGYGGGSALDAAKAIAAFWGNPGELLEYLEVIGPAHSLPHPGLPCVAVPTTSGTGAEVTKNSVLASPAHKVKVSLRGASVYPRLAVVDPALTDHLPPNLTAYTGMDALTQLVEAFLSLRATLLTDALCREALPRAARALPRAFHDGADKEARDILAFASLSSGMALANGGLGAVHGIAGPLGGRLGLPHGAACAALLSPVLAGTLRAAREREAKGRTVARLTALARMLTGRSGATAEEAVYFTRDLARELRIPSLDTWGLRREDIEGLAEAALVSNAIKAHPLALEADEVAEMIGGGMA